MTSGKLVVYCKTYKGDIESFDRLVSSYNSHNKDSLKLYISVPQSDQGLFEKYANENVIVLSDESYAQPYFTTKELWNLSVGYINQEICKLSFWETGIAENYLCVDSDAYFIRDFYFTDFMADEHTPYSVLTMDKDLNIQSFYRDFGIWRQDLIKRIFDNVDYHDRRYRTCHGMTVLNACVLKDFKKNFMDKNKKSYSDLIETSPYEYTWYNAWLQKSNIIEVLAVEPFFKTFHMREEYELSRTSLIKESDIARCYVGIIMNSNWKPVPPPDRYRDPGFMCSMIYKAIRWLR